MHEALPNRLWLGTAADARDIPAVLGRGIVAIVDLAMEEAPIQFPRDILYCRIPLVDGSGNRAEIIRAAVDLTASFIDSGVPTLVACGAGMSRSPIIVAAARAKVDGSPLEEALEEITAGIAYDVSTSLWAKVKAVCEGGELKRHKRTTIPLFDGNRRWHTEVGKVFRLISITRCANGGLFTAGRAGSQVLGGKVS